MGNRTVFVTGGSRGIGLEIARSVLDAGYDVVAVARSRTEGFDELAAEADGRLAFIGADLATTSGQDTVANRIRASSGDLHGLVNNAGSAVAGLHITMARSDIETMWALNVAAAMRLCQAAVKAMYRSSGGRIVNVTSISTHRTFRGLGAYTATKGAVEGFSRVLAAEVGYRGITVNCVAPGFIDTAMTAGLDVETRAAIARRAALARPVTAGDVGRVVAFLLSPAAETVTAQVVRVDSGAIA
jgi:3-oxoacyl-[acyl-carrier protein] reductase